MAYKNLNIHLIFIVLSQLILLVNIVVYGQQEQQFTPQPRVGHAAVLVESRIYYIGGFYVNDSEFKHTSDFFYLKVGEMGGSEKFLSWTDLKSQGVNLPLTTWHTATLGGINQDSIFIIGGVHLDETITNYIYKFDITTNALSVPVIQGKVPPARRAISSVSYGGKIYLFGGHAGLITSYDSTFYNNFDILDTINLVWEVGSIVGSPVTRSAYTAILVDGIIYYIGGVYKGQNGLVYAPMTEIYQYDIVGDKWSLKTATATNTETMPGPRIGHSAVLVNGGKIYVYGGTFFDDPKYAMPSKETFVMLDTNSLLWSIPPLEEPNIPKLYFHTATLNYPAMYIAFGNLTSSEDNRYIYLFLFVEPIKWYQLPLLTPPPSAAKSIITKSPIATSSDATKAPQQSSSPNKMIIVGISVGLVAVILSLLVVSSLAYSRIKKKKSRTNINEFDRLDSSNAFQIPHGGYPMQQYSPAQNQQFAPQQLQQHHQQYIVAPPIQQYNHTYPQKQ